MKSILVAFLAMLHVQLVAQVAWLSPQFYSYTTGSKTHVSLYTLDSTLSASYGAQTLNAQRLWAISTNYQNDLVAQLYSPIKSDTIRLDTIKYPGNYTLAFQSTFALKKYDAISFNQYLLYHGINNAIQARSDKKMDTAVGKVYNQQCAKTLIRIKSTLGKSTYMKSSFIGSSTGLQLEIIANDNPYNIAKPTYMPFTVAFKNRPLISGLVRIIHQYMGKTDITTTNVIDGNMQLVVEPLGKYVLSIIKMEPNKMDTIADWISYSSSLSWGYD
jgi:hypothetical protein